MHWSFQVEKLLDVQREGTDADGTEMRFNTGLLTLHPGGVAEHNLQREGVIGGHLRRRLASYARPGLFQYPHALLCDPSTYRVMLRHIFNPDEIWREPMCLCKSTSHSRRNSHIEIEVDCLVLTLCAVTYPLIALCCRMGVHLGFDATNLPSGFGLALSRRRRKRRSEQRVGARSGDALSVLNENPREGNGRIR